MIVSKRFVFDSAHKIVGHPRCGEVHGHTWTLDVKIEGPVNPVTGMVIDFHTMGVLVKSLLARYDHKYLNDVEGLPTPLTCETFVEYLTTEFARSLYTMELDDLFWVELTLQEGNGGSATYNVFLHEIGLEDDADDKA